MGFASAKKLAQQGFDLILLYRERRAGEQKVQVNFEQWRKDWGIRVWAYNQDALKNELRQQVLQEAQQNGLQVKLLLHSLAKGNLKPVASADDKQRLLSAEDFDLTLNAMASSYYAWASALYQKSLLAPKASLLALTSEGARKAWPHYGAVSAAKAALEAINRQLALELGALGHRANILQPGVTDTPALRLIPGSEKLLALAKKRNPSGELTSPEKVAEVVYFLATPGSEWINGAVIPVDGGESIT
jgi:enoyl-[acyl-carrier-protein] reductase (NADH)